MGSAYDCYTRVPYGSLIATVLCVVGVTVFCSQMFAGVSYSIRMFNEVFHFKVYWMDTIRTVFITVAACMALYSMLLLMVGIAATGATRDQIFKGGRGKIGGRVSIAVCLVITYLLNLVWMGILTFMIILTFVYMMYSQICSHASRESEDLGYCISFKNVGFLFPNTTYPNYDINRFTKCGGEFQRMCQSIKDTEYIYLAACISALVVVISLVHFLICLSANYCKVKEGMKNREVEFLRSIHDGELTTLTKARYDTDM